MFTYNQGKAFLILPIFTYNQGKVFLILPITRGGHMYTWSPLGVAPPPSDFWHETLKNSKVGVAKDHDKRFRSRLAPLLAISSIDT